MTALSAHRHLLCLTIQLDICVQCLEQVIKLYGTLVRWLAKLTRQLHVQFTGLLRTGLVNVASVGRCPLIRFVACSLVYGSLHFIFQSLLAQVASSAKLVDLYEIRRPLSDQSGCSISYKRYSYLPYCLITYYIYLFLTQTTREND